jgi:hypothetical protein
MIALHTNLTQFNSSLTEYNLFIYSLLVFTRRRTMPEFIYHNDYFTCNDFGIKQASKIVEVWIVGDSLVLMIVIELLFSKINSYSMST